MEPKLHIFFYFQQTVTVLVPFRRWTDTIEQRSHMSSQKPASTSSWNRNVHVIRIDQANASSLQLTRFKATLKNRCAAAVCVCTHS